MVSSVRCAYSTYQIKGGISQYCLPASLTAALVAFLVFLDQKFGCDVEQGRLIDLVLTHQEIAEAVNATRVSVTRMLQQFEAERLLSRQSKRLILTRS